jgi:hypothetical protein
MFHKIWFKISLVVLFVIVTWVTTICVDFVVQKAVEDKAIESAWLHEWAVARTGNMDTFVDGDFRF